MIGDAGEDISEPSLRIDVVELAVWMSVYMSAARSAPRSDPANSHDFLPRAKPRRARSAALLTGMMPATRPFRLAFIARGSHESTTGIGASGARNGGRPSYP